MNDVYRYLSGASVGVGFRGLDGSMPSMDELPPNRAPAYTVWRDGPWYRAMNNAYGSIQYQSLDPAVTVQACLTAGGAGTVIELLDGTFVALTGVAATADNQGVTGSGRGTQWDATALPTFTHAFTISGFTGCTLRNFAIETAAGLGRVNHCVLIEDGADDFHLVDITVVNSDSDGIHIEGTTITQGHIHRCHVEGADASGIRVSMTAGNFMHRLHIEDCDIGNCTNRGIYFSTCAGNMYCEIVNNVVYSSTQEGILMVDGDYSMIRGNICIFNGYDGIEINSTIHAQVLGNICYLNGRHGILFTDSDYCTVEGNTCLENDSGDTGTYDGISLTGSNGNLILGNHCKNNDRQGVMVDADSDYNKVSNNYTEGNTAGSIRVNNVNCDGNQLEFNTVEEGAPTDVGTLTRGYGNFDPSANAFFLIGAAPF